MESEWFGNGKGSSKSFFYQFRKMFLFAGSTIFFENNIRSDELNLTNGPISLKASALKACYGLILALINLFDIKFLRRYTYHNYLFFYWVC